MLKKTDLLEAWVAPGNANPTISFDRLYAWLKLHTQKESKAQYLKCLLSVKQGIEESAAIASFVDVRVTNNILHKNITWKDAIQLFFVEGSSNDRALPLAKVMKKFAELEKTFIKNGIDPSTVQVFTVNERQPNKSTYFCWIYDNDADTIYIAKNMGPGKAMAFINSGKPFLEKLVRTSNNPEKLQQQLQAAAAQETSLAARLAANRKRQEELRAAMGGQTPAAPAPAAPTTPAAKKLAAKKLKRPSKK